MELFYNNLNIKSKSITEFDDFETKHIVQSCRKKIDDIIQFTDGLGNLFRGQIIKLKPKLLVKYSLVKKNNPPKIRQILGIGYIRPARLDLIIEKGTELGVDKFFLFSSEYSNYFSKNITRWEKITRQAIKQSLRCFLPEIIIFKNFSLYLEKVSNIKYKYLASMDSEYSIFNTIQSLNLESGDDILFTVGPEGGFSKNELKLADKYKFNFVSLGSQRLRTETAAIAVASYMNLLTMRV